MYTVTFKLKIFCPKRSKYNHLNKQGQTPGHFTVVHQFFDFASWLFDEAGAGAADLLMSNFGLGPYDGLKMRLSNKSVWLKNYN